MECQGPRPRGEDTPTSSDSPRRGYTTERSWVEPETGVRRDVEVVSGLASESQDPREGTARPARADMLGACTRQASLDWRTNLFRDGDAIARHDRSRPTDMIETD